MLNFLEKIMDITSIFKARLEIVRNRNKALGTINPTTLVASGMDSASGGHKTKTRTKGKSTLFPVKKTEYYAKARELVHNISNLREFLVETKASYLNIDDNSMNLSSSTEGPLPLLRSNSWSMTRRNTNPEGTMTDAERDQVDMSVQKIIQNSQKRIFEFQKLIDSNGIEEDHPQLHIHLGNVINSISEYLKEVCAIYAEMKAIRVKRSVDIKTISKISTISSHHVSHSKQPQKISRDSSGSAKLKTEEEKFYESAQSPIPPNDDLDPLSPIFVEEEDFTPDELQIFEEENSLLLQSLTTTADEAEQIESNVVQIAQLQEIFTEKVLLQDKEIGQIANVVIGTTENIKGGNEQLRQAIQQNADFRVWVLFFLIVMSLSLLFLDWYND